MRTKLFVSITVIVLFFVLVGGAYARYGANQALAPEATVGTGFMFQGQLKSDGNAVTASCDMTFGLFDDALSGAQVGSAIAATIPVTNGQFSVMLNSGGEFGPGAFNGWPAGCRWR